MRSWEGAQRRQLTPAHPMDIPDHMALYSARRAMGKKVQVGVRFELLHLLSQVIATYKGALLSSKQQNICVLVATSEWIPCFAFPSCLAFFFSYCIVFISSLEIFHFYPSNSFPPFPLDVLFLGLISWLNSCLVILAPRKFFPTPLTNLILYSAFSSSLLH